MPDDQSAAYAPHIPDQVRQAAARADELAREAGIANMPAEGDQPQADAQPDGDGGNTTVVNDGEPGQQLDLPEIQPAPTQPPTQADWEQRYNTLQGKYNSEMPELRGQVRAMQQMIADMQTQRASAPEPRTRETTFTELPQRPVPTEDVEAYGPDLVNGVQRWAWIAVEPKISAFEHRLSQLEGGMQQTASMTTAQRTEATMDRLMPEWRQVNVDQGFITWLQQVDPFSNRTRQSLINEAYGAGDPTRTVAFFQAYEREHTTVARPPGTQPVQTGQAADRLPLADLAVPGRGAVAAPPTPGAPSRRIWTGADIATFNRQKQRGMWVGREVEAAAIEADYMLAAAEGRVRQ